eukprot:maker-scaffold84_size396325-snap-gene-2.35 protein:Tk09695 transcript:maker-scaffold84_size396325-snap-gene-2.35-mRNA-1 annotation:"peroxisomal membrane protein pex14-like"
MVDASDPKSELPDNPSPPDDEKVTTAIRFLENPKVAPSSNEVKEKFLQKKGLSAEEIRLAFQRAKPPTVIPMASGVAPQTVMIPVPQQIQPHSGWEKFRNFANFIVLIVGAGYGLKYLWENYVREWLYGPKSEPSPEERVLSLQQEVILLLQSLTANVKDLQNSLENQTRLMLKNNQDSGLGRAANDLLDDLKRDVKSIKGLILSPSRFPSSPKIEPPSLPSWQLSHNQEPLAEIPKPRENGVNNPKLKNESKE